MQKKVILHEVVHVKRSELIEEVTQLATLKAIEAFEQSKEQEKKKEKDRRLRNTKLLLRNYLTFQKYVEGAASTAEENKTPIQRLILNEQDLVASIRATTERTIVMIRHLDNALEALAYICTQEDSKHYDILRKRYLEGVSIAEIAKEHDMNDRTVYKLIDTAAERLSVLLFGVYGLKIE